MYIIEDRLEFLDSFTKDYLTDEHYPFMINKILFWGHVNYNKAFEFESNIREAYPEFTVAFAIHCNGEPVDIYEFNNFENGGFEND